MAWGKEWTVPVFTPKPEWLNDVKEIKFSQQETTTVIYSGPNMFPEINGVRLFVDVGKDTNKLKTQGSNLVDNNQYLCFQCNKCLDIFDPDTKSFATLNQKRHDAGWKVIWNLDGMGYKVYCVKCGEDGK